MAYLQLFLYGHVADQFATRKPILLSKTLGDLVFEYRQRQRDTLIMSARIAVGISVMSLGKQEHLPNLI